MKLFQQCLLRSSGRRWSICAGKIETNCDYVGNRFAEEARRIHHGEIDAHSIYGEASEDESRELADEGIDFGRIPWIPTTDS